MENKLTTNNLAPYLGCNLMCVIDGDKDREIEFKGITEPNRVFFKFKLDNLLISFDIDYVTPLLVPMCSISKEVLNKFSMNFRMYYLNDNFKYQYMNV